MRLLAALSAILLLAYPFAVYFGIEKFGLQSVALFLIALFVVRIFAGKKSKLSELKHLALITGSVGIFLLALSFVFNQAGWLTFYPVVVNICMFLMFFSSLKQKQSIIERLARIQDPKLPESGVIYTRNVTKVWCFFFVINGLIALTTCFLSIEVWTLYNGLISYIAMGTLFGIEYLVRIRMQNNNSSKV
ncbi:hypothetical protein P7F88_16260 [Vibrio hannami]|uniref:COG4648 family protein n=1 Tax=Vibrio hannami TaxID=2717094 RepID=UPI00240EB8D0|nr:hypothetical protein [Vibrio hannami]MDG3087531.1 hypothetical protein [Vibrio hannami]